MRSFKIASTFNNQTLQSLDCRENSHQSVCQYFPCVYSNERANLQNSKLFTTTTLFFSLSTGVDFARRDEKWSYQRWESVFQWPDQPSTLRIWTNNALAWSEREIAVEILQIVHREKGEEVEGRLVISYNWHIASLFSQTEREKCSFTRCWADIRKSWQIHPTTLLFILLLSRVEWFRSLFEVSRFRFVFKMNTYHERDTTEL